MPLFQRYLVTVEIYTGELLKPYQINSDGNHGLSTEEVEEAITQSSDAWQQSNLASTFAL